MRWLALYLRSRRAPWALILTGGAGALMWTLWSVFSNDRDVDPRMLVLTVLLQTAALTATLGGPDDALEATAALRWPPRRVAHLLVAFLVVVAPLLLTLATGARFGPGSMVARDAAGLLGLTALSAVAIGAAGAWFLPLGWTLAAVVVPQSGPVVGQILTWQTQPAESTAATVTAGLLAVAGLVAYAVAGPALRAPAEAGQH